MPGFIGGPVEKVLQRGLDVAALRHQVIANNIANVDTPRYKAKDVTFELSLKWALSEAEKLTPATVDSASPTLYTVPAASFRNDGNTVDIDWETVKLAQNTGRFSAFSDILRRRFSLQRYVIREGR